MLKAANVERPNSHPSKIRMFIWTFRKRQGHGRGRRARSNKRHHKTPQRPRTLRNLPRATRAPPNTPPIHNAVQLLVGKLQTFPAWAHPNVWHGGYRPPMPCCSREATRWMRCRNSGRMIHEEIGQTSQQTNTCSATPNKNNKQCWKCMPHHLPDMHGLIAASNQASTDGESNATKYGSSCAKNALFECLSCRNPGRRGALKRPNVQCA